VTLSNVQRGVAMSCSLGYWVGERHARQGIMSEAITSLLPFVFDTLGLHRLEAACLPSNVASRELLRKLSFHEEGFARAYLRINGQWHDHLLFALLASDRDAKKA
jgi:ribosomal-protein-alanine N-acetyltransferase